MIKRMIKLTDAVRIYKNSKMFTYVIMIEIKDKKVEYKNFSYSEDLAKLEVAECLDVKYDYGIESPYVNAMNEEEIEYKKFNNNLKEIICTPETGISRRCGHSIKSIFLTSRFSSSF